MALSSLLFLASKGVAESVNAVPNFPAASNPLGRQGFVRVVNLSETAGMVSIVAFDDGGRKHGPVTLSLDALQTRHFNSSDLEDGAASKGLPTGVGAPATGDWRLELSSELNINVLSYIRTSDGFVTSIHDLAASDGNSHHVAFFNPGSNIRQESLLRLLNPGDAAVDVTINAVDDNGESGGPVTLTIDPGAARTLGAADLEEGAMALTGSLGDGAGKRRLAISANGAITALSMLSTPTRHLTNLSTVPGGFRFPLGSGAPGGGRLSTGSTCPAPDSGKGGDAEFDLVVERFTVSNVEFDGTGAGAYFDYSVQVRNCGDNQADGTAVQIEGRRSNDPSVEAQLLAFETVEVPSILPGASSPTSTTQTSFWLI